MACGLTSCYLEGYCDQKVFMFAQANVNPKSFGKSNCEIFGDEPEGMDEMWFDFPKES